MGWDLKQWGFWIFNLKKSFFIYSRLYQPSHISSYGTKTPVFRLFFCIQSKKSFCLSKKQFLWFVFWFNSIPVEMNWKQNQELEWIHPKGIYRLIFAWFFFLSLFNKIKRDFVFDSQRGDKRIAFWINEMNWRGEDKWNDYFNVFSLLVFSAVTYTLWYQRNSIQIEVTNKQLKRQLYRYQVINIIIILYVCVCVSQSCSVGFLFRLFFGFIYYTD